MNLSSNQRFAIRILAGSLAFWFIRSVFFSRKSEHQLAHSEIAIANVFERVTIGTPLGSSALNPQKYPFLQSRIGRDDSLDLFDIDIQAGLEDFWRRFQLPFATAPETIHLDEQVIKSTLDELLSFNGWAAAACTTLTRPYASDSEDPYADLSKPGMRYFFALVVHSADHFLIDQLAVVVQAARKLGTHTIFVSIVDYASSDSTPFLCDLAESVMVLLGIPFRIRRVPPMTEDPAASYYPLEEAYTRNLALEPLFELYERRKVSFSRVIWLKGFTCPNDILETLRISLINQATMVCGMDWKEYNGFFIYNDRWRTRDLDGNLFRGSKSTSPINEAPPRDTTSAARYQQHLPFQVFCCESGSHIVDPEKSYYSGIRYRSSVAGVFNITSAGSGKSPVWTEGPCMDSAQMHFCRDVWLMAAKDGVKQTARDAKKREKSGKSRGLTREMEQVIRVVAPRLSLSENDLPPLSSSNSRIPDKSPTGGQQGNINLVDHNAHLPQADFDKTDGVGAARDMAADEEKEAARKKEQEVKDDTLKSDEKAVGGKPLPKGQQKVKRDLISEGGNEKENPNRNDKENNNQEPNKIKLQELKPNDKEKQEKEGENSQKKEKEKGEPGAQQAEEVEDTEDDGAPPGSSTQTSVILNSEFRPAKILVNPRCITTYAGVSHTKLALDLFGLGDDIEPSRESGGKYHFDEWLGAPNAFVCQEMRTTGGRLATKQQRRTNFHISGTLRGGWTPGDYV
ncbi:hypothetical protein O181_024531 [Austropuccinia psidii MF-1]|uniref:Capsular associated protein n=1 Tax=Austropuccinia psidii MF-1 TaxID=1389203 RepID=A0A9Q3CGX0_9BASI|nr:hypothetical protein [Austropuccinia psidii MF-1]